MASAHILAWAITTRGLVFIGIIGVLSHRLYFIRGEHHLKAPAYLRLWVLTSLSVVGTIYVANACNVPRDSNTVNLDGFQTLLLLNGSFFTPLFCSIIVYRVLEHPLKDFNGPHLAAISKLWHIYHMFTTPNFIFLDELYHKYGNIVRTGPQELTIVDPNVWRAIGGPGTSCIKSPWYDLMHPYMSLTSFRKKDGYAQRRKRWDEAFGFSTGYLPDKESRVHSFAKVLVRQIYTSAGSPVNVTTWFYHFAFDVIGDLAFGRQFSLVISLTSNVKPHYHYAPALISQAASMLRWFTPAPWLGHICFVLARYLPLVTQKWNRIFTWTAEICDEQLQRETGDGNKSNFMEPHSDSQDNAFAHFIQSARHDDDNESINRLELYGDAFAVAIAGTHTTSAVLTMLFYVLAQRPGLQDELRREIASMEVVKISDKDRNGLKEEIDVIALGKLSLMDGCINETMRLYSPLPSGGARQTVDKGVWIGDRWIPPHTVVISPRWSIGRLESAFERPNEFIPERWTTKPTMIKNINAFNAFGTGRHSCPGKQLGLMEIRMVAVMILANFGVAFASTKNNTNTVIRDTQDAFLAYPGDLELVFTPLEKL
ncbi:cytochrome P450 [Biscogniauxia marginata]|nr:cytochrome P450 [Biscogniauxia marginata]